MRRATTLTTLAFALAASAAAAQEAAPGVRALIDNLRPEAGATRGIRLPAAPGAPGAPPQPAPPAPGTLAATTAPPGIAAVSLTVNFATGSARLTRGAEAVLADLGRALASPDLAPFRFRVEGHTDTTGAESTNQSLSEARAAAVRDHLVRRHGIAPARLEAVGLGETQPLVPTGDNVAEPRNRRVQILNLGG
jgi:outer membrane protein OmpA-like peptidoglycan-associated protein